MSDTTTLKAEFDEDADHDIDNDEDHEGDPNTEALLDLVCDEPDILEDLVMGANAAVNVAIYLNAIAKDHIEAPWLAGLQSILITAGVYGVRPPTEDEANDPELGIQEGDGLTEISTSLLESVGKAIAAIDPEHAEDLETV